MAIQEEMMRRINNHLLVPVLPTDIIIDILSRLSVDSVLSCKCVCKTWRALIDDQVFAQAHTYRLLLLDDDEKQHKPEAFEFFLNKAFDNYNFGEHTYGDITFKLLESITHDYPFPLPLENNDYYSRPYWFPVSSCNGLVCLVSRICHQRICVYNPVTREYVNLPILIYEQPHSSSSSATVFGYHPCTKEYKVVQIYYKTNGDVNHTLGQGQVSVYTLGSGTSSGWRSKRETNFKLLHRHVLVNGAFHWLSQLYGKMEIIAFDLAKEGFKIVPSYPQLTSSSYVDYYSVLRSVLESSDDHSGLGVLEGRYLCVMTLTISTSSNENLCSMWVMNQDYCSWTKKYNIALNESISLYRPLAQSKGGKILLHSVNNQMKIVSSDLKNTSFDDEDVHVISLLSNKQFKKAPYSEIIPYTKSFVSLKALGEDGARTGKKTKELKRVRGANNDGEEQTLTEKRKKSGPVRCNRRLRARFRKRPHARSNFNDG